MAVMPAQSLSKLSLSAAARGAAVADSVGPPGAAPGATPGAGRSFAGLLSQADAQWAASPVGGVDKAAPTAYAAEARGPELANPAALLAGLRPAQVVAEVPADATVPVHLATTATLATTVGTATTPAATRIGSANDAAATAAALTQTEATPAAAPSELSPPRVDRRTPSAARARVLAASSTRPAAPASAATALAAPEAADQAPVGSKVSRQAQAADEPIPPAVTDVQALFSPATLPALSISAAAVTAPALVSTGPASTTNTTTTDREGERSPPARSARATAARPAGEASVASTAATAAQSRAGDEADAATAAAARSLAAALAPAESAAMRLGGDTRQINDPRTIAGAQDRPDLQVAMAGAAPASHTGIATDTPTPAQASLRSAVGTPAFASELGVQLSIYARDGVQHARLELHPLELGPMTVQIQLDGQGARIDFAAEHAQTRRAIEDALPQLAASLREAGLTLSGGGVFEQPRQPQQQMPQQAQPQAGGGRQPADARPGGPGVSTAASTLPQPPILRRRGVVDLVA